MLKEMLLMKGNMNWVEVMEKACLKTASFKMQLAPQTFLRKLTLPMLTLPIN